MFFFSLITRATRRRTAQNNTTRRRTTRVVSCSHNNKNKTEECTKVHLYVQCTRAQCTYVCIWSRREYDLVNGRSRSRYAVGSGRVYVMQCCCGHAMDRFELIFLDREEIMTTTSIVIVVFRTFWFAVSATRISFVHVYIMCASKTEKCTRRA